MNKPDIRSSTYFQNHVGACLRRAALDKVTVLVTSYNRPMAVLIPVEEYEAYRVLREEWESRGERFDTNGASLRSTEPAPLSGQVRAAPG